MKESIVKPHYRRKGKAIYMREELVRHLAKRSYNEILFIWKHVKDLRDGPFEVSYEKLNYRVASELFVLWEGEFYFLYRVHKPSTGPYTDYEWVVHILDIDSFSCDENGNRILDIYRDPDTIRSLAEGDGRIMA